MTEGLWAHFPTPFAPAESTVLTVVNDVAREARLHDQPSVVLGQEVQLDRVDPANRWTILAPHRVRSGYLGSGELAGRMQRAVDVTLGAVVHRRPLAERMYRTGVTAAAELKTAQLFLHDASLGFCGVRPARTSLPDAGVYLYSHVPISRSVGHRELRALLAHMNAHICVSEHLADETATRARQRGEIAVVPNSVDTDEFVPNHDGLTRDPVVVWAGQLRPEKGVGLLIDAVARVPPRVECTLRIVGSAWYTRTAEYARGLRQQAEQSLHPVEFVGAVPRTEMPHHLRSARVFCMPSQWDEPFGLALLEAMSCGLACVASRRGGVPEVGGDAVVYVDPTKTDDFAAAIEWLLTDDTAARDLGQRARARAELFSSEAQFTRLRDVVARYR